TENCQYFACYYKWMKYCCIMDYDATCIVGNKLCAMVYIKILILFFVGSHQHQEKVILD
uniref:Uncharacterized protein n=1 Tax=Oryza brachyantha TaxID=4533 RepID=J3L0V8_ORYBR